MSFQSESRVASIIQVLRVVVAARVAVLCAFFAAASLLAVGTTARIPAQQEQVAASANQHVEGDWVRTDSNGSGDFGGLTSKLAKAELTPEGIATVAANRQGPRGIAFTENRVHGAGDPYIVVDQPCGGGGGGGTGVNPDSSAIHIVEQKDEVVLVREGLGGRHIFMDGRKLPDMTKWTPTVTGFSVGHYESGVLVVDTAGLTPGMVTSGGWRTPETHLNERFEVSPDGKHLTIKYTWSDPKIYVKPHSYEYTFDRLPAGSYAIDEWCDASDPAEKQSIVPPPQ